MTSQKHLFDLPPDIHYLNSAYMSPLMKSVYEAGIQGLQWKVNPSIIASDGFFKQAEVVRAQFAKLINASAQQIAVIPSASYGLKAAINNIPQNAGTHALVVGHEFPSDHYTISQWCKSNQKELKIIGAPKTTEGRAAEWNELIVNTITDQTCAVVLSTIHWADGTKFDLKRIGQKCKASNARFILDGTQSVGALVMDVDAFKIDALVCAAYKWLMGPYSIGLAYYNEIYNDGIPLEDSWMTKTNAEDFTNLTSYVDEYKAGAFRYNMGEFTNPIHLRMLERSLQQVYSWGVDNIQQYCETLIRPLVDFLRENGYWLEYDKHRENHLFGFSLPSHVDKKKLLQHLADKKVFVSLRGDIIRVSPHVYNNDTDIQALVNILESIHSTSRK